jgi:peptidoglycan/xylan/chitin deacetylase (PgdA/CDA1 family)
VTDSIETTGVFWWTYSESHKQKLPEKFQNDFELLWKVPEAERKNVTGSLYADVKERLSREALTADELKEMSDCITFGSHTVNHVITPNCTDEELKTELAESKRKIEEWTGKKIRVFAYPNADHSERDEKFLSETGYDIAVVGGNRFARKNDNRYRIPRMGMGEAYFPEELCHMFGVWQKFIKKFK